MALTLQGGHAGKSQLESVTAVRIDFSQLGLPEVEEVPATAKLGKSHNKLLTHLGLSCQVMTKCTCPCNGLAKKVLTIP